MMTDIPIMPPSPAFHPSETQIIGVLLFVAVLIAYALVTRLRDTIGQRLFCPVRRRLAKVTFLVTAAGQRIDVVRCTIFGRRPITCGKVCTAEPRDA
jgi:hypothetical protein